MLDDKLETFLAVESSKNFTKAAQELSLTQPAVSHHIRQLESEIGAKLFVRCKGGIELTEAGIIALKYARRLKALYGNMRAEIADVGSHPANLRVGITHTAESNIVAEVLAKYSNENHGLIITIITESINNLYNMIGNYEIDLAIVEGQPHNPELCSLMLDTDYLVCVVPINHPLAKKAMVTLNDIRRENLILRSKNSETRSLFISHLTSINESIDDFNVILEVDNIATIKDLIRKDLGISILAKSTCMDELRKKKIAVLPIENLSMIRQTNIVYQKDFGHMEILHGIVELYKHTRAEL